jgi:hypothetical protein
MSGATLDEITGLPDRYTAKLFGPKQVRRIGMVSLGPLLQALGLRLVAVEDPEQTAQIADRITPRCEWKVHGDRRKVR